jgi:hypothetical protein
VTAVAALTCFTVVQTNHTLNSKAEATQDLQDVANKLKSHPKGDILLVTDTTISTNMYGHHLSNLSKCKVTTVTPLLALLPQDKYLKFHTLQAPRIHNIETRYSDSSSQNNNISTYILNPINNKKFQCVILLTKGPQPPIDTLKEKYKSLLNESISAASLFIVNNRGEATQINLTTPPAPPIHMKRA